MINLLFKIILIVIVVVFVLALFSLGLDAFFYGEWLEGIIPILMALLIVIVPLKLYTDNKNKITEGMIVEIGHVERFCSTMFINSGDIMVPVTTCNPAHDYIIIEKGNKKSKVTVKDKNDYKINEYYVGDEQ